MARKDGLRRVNRKETRQHAEATEGTLLLGVKELITPGDRRIQRLLTFRNTRAESGKQTVAFELTEQIVKCQHFDPRRRQFERERQSIEPSTHGDHRRSV